MNLLSTVRKKMLALMIAGAVLLSIAVFSVIESSNDTEDSFNRVVELGKITTSQMKIMSDLRGYQLMFQDSFMEGMEKSYRDFISYNTSLKENLLSEVNQKGLEEIISLMNEWYGENQKRFEILKKYKNGIYADGFAQTEDGKALAEMTRKSEEKYEEITKKVKVVQERVINRNIERNGNTALFTEALLIVIAVLILATIFMIARNIQTGLSSIQQGLNSFFSFLNRETNRAELVKLNSKDEFGEMAKIINENISSIEKEIALDNKLVNEAKEVITRVQHGWYSQNIESTTTNASLEEFKNGVNSMIVATKAHFAAMNVVLEEYAAYNYTKELKLDGIEKGGVFEILVNDINKLRDAVTQMLQNSLANGVELQDEASTLKQAVESLSTASNQQAASLEETAAAMEEMTSNVQNNVSKSNEMANMARETDSAARDGAVLAQRTATAMTEIQSATNSINDAVAIIENIAFQTNILSLNAAVEAATAGDAGKGFAVVAQEVRNLANRSADAAKEIKAMAAQAAGKSNEGMNIATDLTRGFEVIADKIAQTASMVQDVSNANREQMQGIGQINTAVTQLDQMTQENAKVAAQADAIANATIQKAEAMVSDASSKEFIGKNNIRTTQNTQRTNKAAQAAKPVVVSKNTHTSKQALPKKGTQHDGDVWESF